MRKTITSAAIVGVAFIALAGIFCASCASSGKGQDAGSNQSTSDMASFSKYVDKDGTIHLPEDYRLNWTHLGSWAVNAADDQKANMHDVYAEPDAVAKFRTTGKWPDGATIVKEVRATSHDQLATGDVMWDGPIVVWFVMVKDQNDRFPSNPNWGRGWGWALFKADNPMKNVSSDYTADCLSCHVPAKSTDWIYTRGYPTLLETKGPFVKYDKSLYGGASPGSSGNQ
jgi:hypothetical protein